MAWMFIVHGNTVTCKTSNDSCDPYEMKKDPALAAIKSKADESCLCFDVAQDDDTENLVFAIGKEALPDRHTYQGLVKSLSIGVTDLEQTMINMLTNDLVTWCEKQDDLSDLNVSKQVLYMNHFD